MRERRDFIDSAGLTLMRTSGLTFEVATYLVALSIFSLVVALATAGLYALLLVTDALSDGSN